jgi:hypothetical protein
MFWIVKRKGTFTVSDYIERRSEVFSCRRHKAINKFALETYYRVYGICDSLKHVTRKELVNSKGNHKN